MYSAIITTCFNRFCCSKRLENNWCCKCTGNWQHSHKTGLSMLAGIYNRDNAYVVRKNPAALSRKGLSYEETRGEASLDRRRNYVDPATIPAAAGSPGNRKPTGSGSFVMQVRIPNRCVLPSVHAYSPFRQYTHAKLRNFRSGACFVCTVRTQVIIFYLNCCEVSTLALQPGNVFYKKCI